MLQLKEARRDISTKRREWWSDKREVEEWCSRYEIDQTSWDAETEKNLGWKIRETKELSKDDLEVLVHWKFQGLPGREKLVRRQVQQIGRDRVFDSFHGAVQASDEVARISELDNLPGIGPAMVSVILTFYDPANYGVLDIHAWRELFGREPRDLFQGSKRLQQFLRKVREIARLHSMRVRDVEKALFTRNFVES